LLQCDFNLTVDTNNNYCNNYNYNLIYEAPVCQGTLAAVK